MFLARLSLLRGPTGFGISLQAAVSANKKGRCWGGRAELQGRCHPLPTASPRGPGPVARPRGRGEGVPKGPGRALTCHGLPPPGAVEPARRDLVVGHGGGRGSGTGMGSGLGGGGCRVPGAGPRRSAAPPAPGPRRLHSEPAPPRPRRRFRFRGWP